LTFEGENNKEFKEKGAHQKTTSSALTNDLPRFFIAHRLKAKAYLCFIISVHCKFCI